MGFFGFVFWMVIIWLVIRHWSRREDRRMAGLSGSGTGWYDSGEFYDGRKINKKRARQLLGEQQQYIESLEARVSELEERLDFTERLLAERREAVSG